MKRAALLTLLAMLASGPAAAAKNDNFTIFFPADQNCAKFANDHATGETRAWREGNTERYRYPPGAALEIGWIMGYITAANEHAEGAENFFLDHWVDNITWIADWCRAHPANDLLDAVQALNAR